MLYYVFFSVLILASLAGIAVIAARKFPRLTLIDAESLPDERDAQKKKEIIGTRVTRALADRWKKAADAASPAIASFGERFRKAHGKIMEIDHQLRHDQASPVELEQSAAESVAAADALRAEGKDAEAEAQYIAALRVDPLNAEAYEGLGELALAAKNYEQAKETYRFLAKLYGKREGDEDGRQALIRALVQLGGALRELRDYPAAKEVFARVSGLEPANPKYLDFLLDACILVGDKAAAEEAFAAFVVANPENQKLEALRGQIDALPEPARKARKKT